MSLSMEEIARAFSSHHFEAAHPYLTDGVTWTIVGDADLAGRDSVIGRCEQTTADLSEIATEFRRLRTLVGIDWVVIDSLAEYTDREHQASLVASCDIYDFNDGMLSAITSYNIALSDA